MSPLGLGAHTPPGAHQWLGPAQALAGPAGLQTGLEPLINPILHFRNTVCLEFRTWV